MKDYTLFLLGRGCLRKHRYQTEQAANEHISKINKERKTPLRVYFCKFCLGYHLTSKPLKEHKQCINTNQEN